MEVDRHPDFFMLYVSGCSSKCPFTTITTQTLAGKNREVLLLSTMDLFHPTVLITVVVMAVLLLLLVVVAVVVVAVIVVVVVVVVVVSLA